MSTNHWRACINPCKNTDSQKKTQNRIKSPKGSVKIKKGSINRKINNLKEWIQKAMSDFKEAEKDEK